MKFLFIIFVLLFAGNVFGEDIPEGSAGPAGPVPPTMEESNSPLIPPEKPTMDLPYKPGISPSPSIPSETTDTSVEVKIPFLPSLSPDPIGAPDPQW